MWPWAVLKLMFNRTYYKTAYKYPTGLYCPLGQRVFYPNVRIWLFDGPVVPFSEFDAIVKSVREGTYESASQEIAEKIQRRYSCAVCVRVGDSRFWADCERG